MKKNKYMAPRVRLVDIKSSFGLLNGTSMKFSTDTVSDSNDIGFSRGDGNADWED